MFLLNDFFDKEVVDGRGKNIGICKGLAISNSEFIQGHLDNSTFIKVMGEPMTEIRGNNVNFIPSNQINSIEENIRIYSTLEKLSSLIKSFDTKTLEPINAAEFIGQDVFCNDGIKWGNVSNVGLQKSSLEFVFIVYSPKMSKIRGHDREAVLLKDFNNINEKLEIDLPHKALVDSIKNRKNI
jgi:sporulation protein YlmC with PRC-barrel domain